LTILSFYGMNLSMIQSLPIVGREWEYQFYINLLFDDYQRYKQAIDAIVPLTKEFKILGEYEEGKQNV
jgi:prephenate dehydratase